MFGKGKKSAAPKKEPSAASDLVFGKSKRRATGKTPQLSPAMRVVLTATAFCALGMTVLGGGARLFYRCYFTENDLFTLSDTEKAVVDSGQAMPPELVREYLGIRKGVNLFAFGGEDPRGKLMQDAPNIKSISVQCILPDQMAIKIVEREPVARLAEPGLVVDDEGVIFTRRGLAGMPVITGVENEARIEPGGKISGLGMAAIKLAMVVNQPVYSFRVLVIDASKPDYLLLTMTDHRQAKIAWSGMDDPDKETSARMTRQLRDLSMVYANELSRNKLMFNATIPGRVAASD